MLIDKSNLKKDSLEGKIVLLTGGGGGIGFEAGRALVRLGAEVILAEIDREKGAGAEKRINAELNTDRAHFFEADLSDEKQLGGLCAFITERFGRLDVLFNNATVTPFGPVGGVAIEEWDKSYAVNLRAPLLLVERFLPEMKKRGAGTIVFVPSSGAAPYMGAYEVFKTAQVELCNTLAAELEDTNIAAYSIGPGLVKTETAQRGIDTVARYMNISTDEFYKMNESKMLDAEAAGTGFAISVALAERYRGQEIGAIQALIDAGVFSGEQEDKGGRDYDAAERAAVPALIGRILATYADQYDGWLKRNIFERQWVLRDFKKTAGRSADDMKNTLEQMAHALERGDFSAPRRFSRDLALLKTYYEHQHKLLQGYEKDPKKLKENSDIITGWVRDLESALSMI
ncbi:NAD(P)-dependent dehydrogenase, short-chain alcohol dehydrogenase family [Sporobacter termitidis DSM 10068]|uniref:NAD(P)-dependent dehydrogenase, short-chain alcohol dehydrogenase family n=1 Tax=Sporobacter termitidis DSM 10068 TaxID=1123282 RepID=A0A1M5YLK1_9FIRM|nr:SDR family oxidoreductase [Sporobacter termitidis]SHI12957.1 NAD(P)-dependent dehydrogenase, short-chain alcohol dehydrogenase family [Sporobacter termitidis DSM 10068]